ncbi:hypothetical protein LTR56_006388 [Elasticomyces elasticus]|nr:hypothetical protein LTR56_006388 [Elasticomyces elasticus]KAK3663433.1 hypothetical protein LTR22_005843 [Elasticomyces elasticus]KAK4925512.1 hypothetical protein LTR49_007579 [Elasticomyces elasticus]KAK5764607.1 hypothetical protein LTS12_005340 [Elasticomyces elasticus]
MSGRPKKACSTCQVQKIRCTGERPTRKRCLRLKHVCNYLTPVTGAAPRITQQARRQVDSDLGRPAAAQARPSLAPNPYEHTQDAYLGIPRPLVGELVAAYFDNVANASLLLHKRSFLDSLHAGTVAPHVLLSVCASGANFYQDCNGFASLRTQGFMTEWAQRAGKLAFSEIETFNKDLAVTFLNLSMYWYSQGSWKISSLHRANGFHSLWINGAGDVQQQQQQVQSWEAEAQRRRFWAWYIMHCHDGERSTDVEPVADIQSLPLPWCEEDFVAGTLRAPAVDLTCAEGSTSLFAGLVKIATMWSSAVHLIKAPQAKLTSDRLAKIHAFDHKVTSWWQSLPSIFRLTSQAPIALGADNYALILLLNLFYHQILCVLHASIVPLFCWTEGDNGWASARQLSAQIAFEHANAVSALITATLSSPQRLSAMPTFVAYAAYGGCAIQIPFIWSSNAVVRHQAQANVRSNIRMICAMAEYWKFAALLSVHVRCLYNIHKQNPPALENEPKYVDIHKLTEFRIESLYARVSILEFLGILRRGRGSYTEPGEETTDLGIRQSRPEADTMTGLPAIDDFNALTDPVAQIPAPIDERLNFSTLIQTQQWNLIPPDSTDIDASSSILDMGNLGSEMTGNLQSEYSFGDLDIDGWTFDPFTST